VSASAEEVLALGETTGLDRAVQAEWGEMLIRGWNKAGWMAQPRSLGDGIGRLIGAAPGTVVLGDSLSIKVYQALASALERESPGALATRLARQRIPFYRALVKRDPDQRVFLQGWINRVGMLVALAM
jgi:hypothetical protein